MKFLDMKVKEFIDFIRPITAINPDHELTIEISNGILFIKSSSDDKFSMLIQTSL